MTACRSKGPILATSVPLICYSKSVNLALIPGDLRGASTPALLEDTGCVVEPQRLWHLATPASSISVTDSKIARNLMDFPIIYEGTPIAKPRLCQVTTGYRLKSWRAWSRRRER
jgi:hypothetical protein